MRWECWALAPHLYIVTLHIWLRLFTDDKTLEYEDISILELGNAPRLPNATITKPTILSSDLHATKVHLLHNERCKSRSGERNGNTAKQTTVSYPSFGLQT